MLYKTIMVNGVKIFYREAGRANRPAILFLHGFPSSSRMYKNLMPYLEDKYHLIAPDYPGFGYSAVPAQFKYTFDSIAGIIDAFTLEIGLTSYTLFMQDYGGPVGFRLAMTNSSKVKAMIVQNAAVHEEGLSVLWDIRKAYWRNRYRYEDQLKANFSSLEATRQRHIGNSPTPECIDPDTWTDEYAFLNQPGILDQQLDLFYDYRTNVASYSKWQEWLRTYQPPMLVLWGTYDPSFKLEGAAAYQKDVPACEVKLLKAGHFAMDEALFEIAQYTRTFLRKHLLHDVGKDIK